MVSFSKLFVATAVAVNGISLHSGRTNFLGTKDVPAADSGAPEQDPENPAGGATCESACDPGDADCLAGCHTNHDGHQGHDQGPPPECVACAQDKCTECADATPENASDDCKACAMAKCPEKCTPPPQGSGPPPKGPGPHGPGKDGKPVVPAVEGGKGNAFAQKVVPATDGTPATEPAVTPAPAHAAAEHEPNEHQKCVEKCTGTPEEMSACANDCDAKHPPVEPVTAAGGACGTFTCGKDGTKECPPCGEAPAKGPKPGPPPTAAQPAAPAAPVVTPATDGSPAQPAAPAAPVVAPATGDSAAVETNLLKKDVPEVDAGDSAVVESAADGTQDDTYNPADLGGNDEYAHGDHQGPSPECVTCAQDQCKECENVDPEDPAGPPKKCKDCAEAKCPACKGPGPHPKPPKKEPEAPKTLMMANPKEEAKKKNAEAAKKKAEGAKKAKDAKEEKVKKDVAGDKPAPAAAEQ